MSNNTPYPIPLTKREQFVIAAMQGICLDYGDRWDADEVARYSIEIADATINRLSAMEAEDVFKNLPIQ